MRATESGFVETSGQSMIVSVSWSSNKPSLLRSLTLIDKLCDTNYLLCGAAENTEMGEYQIDLNKVMPTAEASAYLDVSEARILQLYHKGRLEGIKVGRDLLFTKASLDEYQKNRRPAGRPLGAKSRNKSQKQQSTSTPLASRNATDKKKD